MPTPKFTTRQLSAFMAVADLGSFAKASQKLNLSSSAISQLVSELESAIGFRVFDRTTRSVSITSSGSEFYKSAKSVLTHMELAQAVADNVRDSTAGIVRVAAPLILASTVLPAVVKAFTSDKPEVLIRIKDAYVENLVEHVSDGAVELAIGPDWPVTDDVERHDLFESQWVLWLSPDHLLASSKEIPWSALRNQALIVAGRDYERTISLVYADSDNNQNITPVHVVEHITTAFGMAAQGLGVLIAPAYVGLLGSKFGLIMKPIAQPYVVRKVCLYNSRTQTLTTAALDFSKFLTKWLDGKDDLGISASA
ncbi:LysR family transcriptional regulator [Pseudomonas sp. NPDC089996]|uniref:LysR family transcriptional regulator n=1 Tax=Pseudomonas sp. NPDC089996 TaxID=3364474 RepID=UPI0038001225